MGTKQAAIVGASTLLASGLLYAMNSGPPEVEVDIKGPLYHIGVEMGGTSCKVGIIEGLDK